jgi:NAD(P)-dependent dehydrogenase (short-subunit alcohol dehydrogenase family)
MVEDLRGKRCFVTGAASGIGRATAIAAGRRGAELLLTDIDAAGLERAAEEVRQAGGTVSFSSAADVSDYEAVVGLASDVHTAGGSVDVVMNIAGISTWGWVEDLSHEDWRRQVDVNLLGPIHVIESFIPPMIEAGHGGNLVNVSSAAGLFGLPAHAAYSAAKFGLRGVSEVLRFDLERHGIGVTLVCPGAVDTPLIDSLKIAGDLDRESPEAQKFARRFRKHAVSAEEVGEQIVRAIARNRYLVLTSRDIRVGHWFQRKFEPAYRFAMRRLNDRFDAIAKKSRRAGQPSG